jgi:hypothetical protein
MLKVIEVDNKNIAKTTAQITKILFFFIFFLPLIIGNDIKG